jgi:hypothetical protein
MHRGFLFAGVIVIALGAVATAIAVSDLTTSVTVPEYPLVLSVSVNTLGSATLTVDWSGANASTQTMLLSCSAQGCGVPGPALANATGRSGTLRATLVSGTTYLLTENGTGGGFAASLHVLGVTLRLVLGIAVIAAGIVLAAWAFRRPRSRGQRIRASAGESTSIRSPEDELR